MPMSNPAWDAYCSHISTWYHEPDLQALEILTSNLYAHIHLNDPPAWIFLIGPSSSGKTRLGIDPYATAPRAFTISNITAAGFYSVDKSKKIPVPQGLLVEAGGFGATPGNAIWLFQDFTSCLTKDRHDFDAIMSALREIHDGRYSRDIGQIKRSPWRGKITCQVACTGAIDSYLASNRDFGERFLMLRLRTPQDTSTMLRKARIQNGKQDHIQSIAQGLMAKLLSTPPTTTDPIELDPSAESRIDALAWLASKISIVGKRNSAHKLVEIGDEAFPARLIQSVQTIIRGHALLFNHASITDSEHSLAHRLVYDTIPTTRRKLLQALPIDKDSTRTFQELQTSTSIPPTTLRQELETLVHSHALIDLSGIYFWSPTIKDLIHQADITK